MNEDLRFKSLQFEPLSVKNLNNVYEMCEASVKFISHPLNTFKKATIKSKYFIPEFSIVAFDTNGIPIAFFMVVFRKPHVFKFRNIAVLKFFVVQYDWRNKGLGTYLYNELLSRVKKSEYKCFHMKFDVMLSAPDYWFPGLDPRHTEAFFFLKKLGFKKGIERIHLTVDLDSTSTEKPITKVNDIIIERALPEDIEELSSLSFMNTKYRWSYWPDEIRLSFENEPISTFVARDSQNVIVGWATHSVSFPGCFGPIGVSKKVRGRGIGGLLLNCCLWDLKRKGIKKCFIRWVGEGTAYFYLKSAGAKIGPFYWTMSKRI